ncbi:MAG: hypothetical protein AABX51_08345 [Nanoarchaeota archaeon]
MYDEMAMSYFQSLDKAERKRLLKLVIDQLDESEKLALAKMLVKK